MKRPTASALEERIANWLSSHDDRLRRFENLVALGTAAREIGIGEDELRLRLTAGAAPPYHIWHHTHAGQTRRSKPYCLRMGGPDEVALDWEESVVAVAGAAFARAGFEIKRQLGDEVHIASLSRDPHLAPLQPGSNLRDLWALRRDSGQLDLWIIEAKGKEASGFEHYCVAEALGQIFPVPAAPLSELLGSLRRPGHGLCWVFAQRLAKAWRAAGYKFSVTLGLLLPYWRPDMVWAGGAERAIPGSYFDRPIQVVAGFLGGGDSSARAGAHKYQRAFGGVLEAIQAACDLRGLASSTAELRFRVLLAEADGAGEFRLTGLE